MSKRMTKSSKKLKPNSSYSQDALGQTLLPYLQTYSTLSKHKSNKLLKSTKSPIRPTSKHLSRRDDKSSEVDLLEIRSTSPERGETSVGIDCILNHYSPLCIHHQTLPDFFESLMLNRGEKRGHNDKKRIKAILASAMASVHKPSPPTPSRILRYSRLSLSQMSVASSSSRSSDDEEHMDVKHSVGDDDIGDPSIASMNCNFSAEDLIALPEFAFVRSTDGIMNLSVHKVVERAALIIQREYVRLMQQEQSMRLETHRLKAKLRSMENHTAETAFVSPSARSSKAHSRPSSRKNSIKDLTSPRSKRVSLAQVIENIDGINLTNPENAAATPPRRVSAIPQSQTQMSFLRTNVEIDVDVLSPARPLPTSNVRANETATPFPCASPPLSSLLQSPTGKMSKAATPLSGTLDKAALLTQRGKLRTPRTFSSLPESPRTAMSSTIEKNIQRIDEHTDETRKKRNQLLEELLLLAEEHNMLRSYQDIRIIPRDEATQTFTMSGEDRMQQLLDQHRQWQARDSDANMQATMQILSTRHQSQPAITTFENDEAGSKQLDSYNALTLDENWGKYPAESGANESLLGRGKFGSVHSAVLRLHDVELMKNVLNAQVAPKTDPSSPTGNNGNVLGQVSAAEPALSIAAAVPTAAFLAFAASNRNLVISDSNLTPSRSTLKGPDSAGMSPANRLAQSFDAMNKSRRGLVMRNDVYQQHLQYLQDMISNPFSQQQAAFIPLTKTVALKIASFKGNRRPKDRSDNDEFLPPAKCLEEFLREVKALLALVHPNVIRMEGVVLRPLTIILELVNGPSLAQALVDHSAGGWQEILTPTLRQQLLFDVASGLRHIHAKGFVHRDIKSHNIMIQQCSATTYLAKIVDLGTAVQIHRPLRRMLSDDMSMNPITTNAPANRGQGFSRRGSRLLTPPSADSIKLITIGGEGQKLDIVGTSGYTAPEVLAGKPYGFPADVFSFGIVAWEIFASDATANPLSGAEADIQIAMMEAGVRPTWQITHLPHHREVISFCWQTSPSLRPVMSDVAAAIMASPDCISSKTKEDAPYFRFRAKH